MQLADLAWRDVSPQTIANCWVKSSILPGAQTAANVLTQLEDEGEEGLSKVLDSLQSVGVLQKGNRMDISDLLDIPEEQLREDATDEEIFEVVMHAEGINGGDENPADDPKPTRKEALQAVSTLRKYLSDVDGAFVRKLELGLATFGRETELERSKNLVSTSITDYFVRA
jgi:hypothetical protein